MSELSRGWESVKLSDIALLVMGQSPPSNTYNKSKNGLPFFQGKAEFGDLHPTPVKYCSEPLKVAKPNDVLISVRAPIGPTNLCSVESCIGRGLAAIRPLGGIPSLLILYYLRSIEEWLSGEGTGSTFTQIGKTYLEEIELPLPPLNEQRRIVAKLERVLSRVDAAQARLATIPRILKRFRQSVIDSACVGSLTAYWRGQHGNGFEETTGELGEFARFIDYRGKTPTKTESGIPLITAKNIRRGYLSIEPREYIAEDNYDKWMTRGFPRRGDVLITTEAPLGYVVCIDWNFKFALAQRVICLQFDKQVAVGKYASLVLLSTEFQRDLLEEATGSTVTGIKASRLKRLSITFPSTSEQKEIVRRVEALFKTADALEARYLKAKAHVDKLTQSILAKAFRGELVPQDRNDEPASVLLDRIRQRKQESLPKKTKR